MRRLVTGLMVLSVLSLALVLSWSSNLTAEPLSIDSLEKPAGQKEIPELKDAVAKLQQGDVDGALADIKVAVEKNPELPPAQVIMAQFFSLAQQGEAVRVWLERAVNEVPNDPQAYALLGQNDIQTNRMVEARLLFEKAHDLLKTFDGNPNRKEELETLIYSQLARLAMQRQDWDTAKAYINDLLQIRPNDATPLQLLGRVLFDQGKPAEALEKLKAAKALDEKMLTPEAILAQWYESKKDRENATKYMVEALKIAPNDFETRIAAAEWAFGAQEFDQAFAQAEIALKLDPKSAQANLLAGSIAMFQEDYPTAEKYLDAALKLSPDSFHARNNLALALCEQDDESKKNLALRYAQLNEKLYPNDTEPLSTLGRVLFRLGRYQEAGQAFQRVAATRRPMSPDTAYYIAALYAEGGQTDQAKQVLEDALKATGLFSQRKAAENLMKKLSK